MKDSTTANMVVTVLRVAKLTSSTDCKQGINDRAPQSDVSQVLPVIQIGFHPPLIG